MAGRSLGTMMSVIGDTAAETIGFHGVTGVAQAAAIVSVSTSVVTSVCGVAGLTFAQASGIIVALNAVLAALNAKGLIAS